MGKTIKAMKRDIKTLFDFMTDLMRSDVLVRGKLDSLEENIIELIAEQEQILKEKVIEERKRSRIEDFDNFVSNTIQLFKDKLEKYKFSIEQNRLNKIPDVIKGFDTIIIEFNDYNKSFSKKLMDLNGIVDNPDENSIKII